MGRPKSKLTDLSKGTSSFHDGVSLSSVAMVAGVPLSRVRYQVKVLAQREAWQPVEKKLLMGVPAAGKSVGMRKAGAVAVYNLVTTGRD